MSTPHLARIRDLARIPYPERIRLNGLGAAFATLCLATTPSLAADYLRGAYAGDVQPKSTGIDWAGFYAGGHVGYSSHEANLARLNTPLAPNVRNVLPNLPISSQLPTSPVTDPSTLLLGRADSSGVSYGGFVGVNYLWDDVVLGFEGDYTRSDITLRRQAGPNTATLTAASTGTDQWDVSVSTQGQARVTDYGTIRGRVGWAIGNFLPFVTAGLAIGNVEATANADGAATQYTVTTDPVTGAQVRSNPRNYSSTGGVGRRGLAYGGAVGAGIDVALFSNVFLRAEWQYVQFPNGDTRPSVYVNTARVAGAVKF